MTQLIIDNTTIKTDSEGRYCLNDLNKAAGGEIRHRPIEFIRLEQTQELIGELQKGGNPHLFLETTKGRNGGTAKHQPGLCLSGYADQGVDRGDRGLCKFAAPPVHAQLWLQHRT